MSYETLARRRLWAPSADQNLADCPPALLAAKDALTQFATRQLGLSLGVPRWETRVQVMDVKAPEGWQRAGPLAVLDLQQTPGAILGVELAGPRQFTAWLMRARPDAAEPDRPLVWKSAQAVVLPADVPALTSALDRLLAEGVIAKTAEGLRFTGKTPEIVKPHPPGPPLLGREDQERGPGRGGKT
jgi:hypothetical protein